MNKDDIQKITDKIAESVQFALGEKWEEAKEFAESESKKFANNIAEIAAWKESGKVSEEQGRVLLGMHKRSMKMVLTALEGISLVLAERAINAAVDAIGSIVNSLIGWDLF